MIQSLSELRILIDSVIHSGRSLLWCFLLLVSLIVSFSIVLTTGATSYRKSSSSEDIALHGPALDKMYGSLSKSMYTLFKSITGGLDWGEAADAIAHAGPGYTATYITFIFFTIFSVLNIVTGIFVEGAIENAKQNRTAVMSQAEKHRINHMVEMMTIMKKIDEKDKGFITWQDYTNSLEDENLMKFWHSFNITVNDAAEVFAVLDRDCDGVVDLVEFVEGMRKFEGLAKSTDIQLLRAQIQNIEEDIMVLEENLVPAKRVSDIRSTTISTASIRSRKRSRLESRRA